MRNKISNYEYLKAKLAEAVDDDFTKPWNYYPCLEWERGKDHGYGTIWLVDDSKHGGRSVHVHRMAHTIVIGPIPDGTDVLHRCDNPPCFRPIHMFLGTDADNVRDCMEKGRRVPATGERNGHSKFTDREVRIIRKLRKSKMLLRIIREQFPHASLSMISHASTGRTWKHLKGTIPSERKPRSH